MNPNGLLMREERDGIVVEVTREDSDGPSWLRPGGYRVLVAMYSEGRTCCVALSQDDSRALVSLLLRANRVMDES